MILVFIYNSVLNAQLGTAGRMCYKYGWKKEKGESVELGEWKWTQVDRGWTIKKRQRKDKKDEDEREEHVVHIIFNFTASSQQKAVKRERLCILLCTCFLVCRLNAEF